MVKDYNLGTLLSSEEHNDAIEEAMQLESDIKFFEMYISRNQKSRARFNLNFSYGSATKFFSLVDTRDYSTRKLQKTMMEYKVLSKMANQIADGTNIPYTEDTMKEIYMYFLEEYSISLEEIIDMFIGCSFLSGKVVKKMNEIKNSI